MTLTLVNITLALGIVAKAILLVFLCGLLYAMFDAWRRGRR